MGEIFKLFGTIGVDNGEANDALDETTKKGETAANKINNTFKKLSGKFGSTFAGMGKKLNLEGMHQQFNQLGGKINKTLVSAVKTGAKAMAVGGTAAMAGAGALLVKSMNIAGELEQNLGGSEAVFGKYATNMQKMGTTAFKTMGLSQSDFLANANKMGSLYQGVGFSVKESMDMSGSAMQRAADVASIMGLDIDSAMEAVGGMAKGNFEMMDNLGVAINDTAIGNYALSKGISKSTAEMSTQEKVGLATQMFMEKTAKYAGNYAKENDTLAGSLQTAKGALGNFLSGAGSIDDVITTGMDFAKVAGKAAMELAPKLFTGISQAIQELIPQIPSIVGSLASGMADFIGQTFGEEAKAKFEGLTDTLSQAFEGLKEGLAFIAENKDIFLPIAVGIGAIVAVLGVWNALTTVATALQTAFNVVLNANPLGLVVLAITGVVAALTFFFTKTETGKAIWQSFMNFLSTAWATIKTTAINVWTAISTFFSNTWTSIKTTATNVWNSLTSFLSGLWNGIKSNASNVFNSIKSFFSNTWTSIKTTATNVWNGIKSFLSGLWNGIKSTASSVWNGIKSTISNVVNGIKSTISNVFNAIKSTISSIFNGIRNVASSVWNGIKSVITKLANDIRHSVVTVFGGLKSAVSSVWNGIKNAISTPINAAKNAVSSAIAKIKSIMNFSWSLPPLKLPHFSISGKFSLKPPSIPKIGVEWYKSGGIMDDPTAFGMNGNSLMVGGEAGREAILPLNRENLGMIGQGVAAEMNYSQAAVVSKLDELIDRLEALFAGLDLKVVMDSGDLVGAIRKEVDKVLGRDATKKERGRAE